METYSNKLLSIFKSKYILAEVLALSFYCHEGYQWLYLLCKDSRKLLLDEYILRQLKKKHLSEFFIKRDDIYFLNYINIYLYNFTVMIKEGIVSDFVEHITKI